MKSNRPRFKASPRRKSLLPLVVLLLGLTATFATCWQLSQEIDAKQAARFERSVVRNTSAITGRVDAYIAMLRGGVGLFNAADEVSAEEFAAFSESLQLDTVYPGIQGIGYSKRLDQDEVSAFEAQQREAGRPDFHIWPDLPDREERHTIVYLQPMDERNATAVGFDMSSEERRREAMNRARDTGEPAVTAKLTLVQEIDDDVQPGFLIYAPLYSGVSVPETVEARREQLEGFVYSPFRAHDLFRGILPEHRLQVATFAIYEGAEADPERLLYQESEGLPSLNPLTAVRRIELAGRPFTIVFTASSNFARESRRILPMVALILGTGLSLLLAALVWRQDVARLRAERSEADLREREEQLALSSRILQSMTEGVILVDDHGCITFSNEAEDRIFSYGNGELIGRRMIELSAYSAEENERKLAEVQESLEKSGQWSGEWMNRRKDGSVFFTHCRVNVVTLGGRPHRIWAQHDITESRRAAEAFAESEARFRAVVEATPECVKIVSESGRLEYMNPAGRRLLGIDEGESLDLTVEEFVAEPYREEWRSHHRRVCAGESLTWQFQAVGSNKVERWMETHAVPLRIDGKTAQLGVTIDITNRKRLEAESAALLEAERAARTEAERIGRMKDEFLATLSHELRTPLTAIIGWTDLMRHASLSEEDMATGLETIQRNAQAQVQLTSDLLDMNRIISGKIHLEVEPVNVDGLITAAIETVAPLASAKGVELESSTRDLPEQFHSDPARLRQILWNLLTNAVKFSRSGGSVRLRAYPSEGELCLEVEDDGQGIAPDFLPHVFDRFRQADSSSTRTHGGLGLGLSIVKSIVDIHGGSVSAYSEGEGKGARFTVLLPEMKRRKGKTPAGDPKKGFSPLSGKNILVVEDEKDSRDIIERMLRQANARTFTASSAREGWKIAENEDLDLIVSDIGMPEIDGYSFLRSIRERGSESGGDVPAIALTAFARSVDRRRAEEAGYQQHVAKPVDAGQLLSACASALRE